MKDIISISRINLLHPKAKDTFINFIDDIELSFNTIFRVVQGLRTIDEQNKLYAQGRTIAGKIVTNAKGGFSYHNYGLAIDIVEMKDNKPNWNFDYKKLEQISKKYNLSWGGNFKSIKDNPHFELTFGYSINDLYQKYLKKDFISGTFYLNI